MRWADEVRRYRSGSGLGGLRHSDAAVGGLRALGAAAEAGPDYPDFETLPDDLKLGNNVWLSAYGPHNWGYTGQMTPEQPELQIPRGRATGGSSAVNGRCCSGASRKTTTAGPNGATTSGASCSVCPTSISWRPISTLVATTSTGLRVLSRCAGTSAASGCPTPWRSRMRACRRATRSARTRTIQSQRRVAASKEHDQRRPYEHGAQLPGPGPASTEPHGTSRRHGSACPVRWQPRCGYRGGERRRSVHCRRRPDRRQQRRDRLSTATDAVRHWPIRSPAELRHPRRA